MTNLESDIPEQEDLPIIQSDEDEPLLLPNPAALESQKQQNDLVETDDIGKEITRFRYKTAKEVLYIAMGAMGLAVVLDLLSIGLHLESGLITNAFEAFKLITMTVLGYIFGSNSSKNP